MDRDPTRLLIVMSVDFLASEFHAGLLLCIANCSWQILIKRRPQFYGVQPQ